MVFAGSCSLIEAKPRKSHIMIETILSSPPISKPSEDSRIFSTTLPIIFESNRPEPSYLCFVDDTHRKRFPKWMTQPEAESFSLSQHPIIDPFAILLAHQMI
jgi:hypothetical protein